MKVRKYHPETDFEEIQSWGREYGAEYSRDLFPPLGFIVPGVCAYFIYCTQSKVCWLENMVKNPSLSKEITDMGLQLVVSEVLKEINRLGLKMAYATTDNPSVVNRALSQGAIAYENQTLLQMRFENHN